MIIYDSYDNVLLETKVSDKSSLYCGLDNKDRLTLHFTLDRHVEIPIGAWCNFEGNRYEVMSDADVKMNHTENYDYTVVLSSYFALVSRYKVCNMVDRRLKFDLVAKPHEHLQMIVDNLNSRDGGWSIGNCIDSVEKLVSYNHTNCEEALVSIADTFSTEIEVVGKVISLKKVEYFKDDPLALSYGKGNGFRPGIQRTSVDDGLPVQRLFVQGGSRNISLKEYGSSELHLPKLLSFKFDGNKFEGEEGFVEKYAKSFKTDADGMSVSVDGMTGGREDSLDLSEVYPSRVCKVTGVVYIFKGNEYTTPESSWTADDWNEVQIDIIDNTIPDSLDFNECLMENNEPLTVVFQSGMLAGRELNANYLSDKKRFQLIKQEFDGQPMPQDSFIPKVDDSYAVFNVYLPASYISDATTYSGAEYDILREASRYLYEKCVSEFNFAGEIDGMWAKKNWDTIGPRMRIGSYVSFTHEKMFPDEPALVRIVGITQYVNNPHYPKIELSNTVGSSTVSSRLNKIENKDAHVAELYEEARRYTKRRYTDIKQTIEMLSDAFDNYSEGINPITVETMLAVVGDKSLQYLFTQSLDTDAPSVLEYSFDPNDGVFSVSDAFIKHMTLEIDSISPVHSNDEYLRWNVAAYASESLEKDSGYYLYAKVSKDSQQGTFLLSKESIKLEAEEGYYNLLVGILNAEVDGDRSFASMYGFTEILPGQITTDTIKSADGNTWLDLLKGILHLNNMAGVSGVKTEEKGDQSIAAWFGGLMKDIELDDDKENAAKSVIRHDGTGYFADGLFKWDKDKGINLGNGAIWINYDGSVDFGDQIRIGASGEETLGSLLTIVATLADIWKIDEETGDLVTDRNVRIAKNVIIGGDMSSTAKGRDAGAAGGIIGVKVGDDEYTDIIDGLLNMTDAFKDLDVDVDLSDYYTNEETDAKITESLIPYAKIADIGSTYATKTSLETLQGEVDNIEAVLGMDEEAEGIINTWNEVKAFLDGYSSSDDLAAILSTMNADIAKRALDSDLGTLAGRVGVNELAIADNAGNIKKNFDAIEALTTRVKAEEDITATYKTWWDDLMSLIVKDGTNNIKINGNLIVAGDTSTGGTGSNPEVAGTLIGIKVNGQTYDNPVNGILTIPDYPTSLTWSAIEGKPTNLTEFTNDAGFITSAALEGYALKTEIPTTMAWTAITGKPSFAAVATSGKYGDLTGRPTIPSNTSQIAESGNLYFTNARAVSALADTLKDYVTKTALASDLGEYASKEWVTEKGYITSAALEGYALKTEIPTTMAWTAITGKPSFAAVATSGKYGDLTGRPTIPSNTSQIAESGNLYFTNARAVSALADTLKDYVTKTALASDLGEYASKEWVTEKGYITGITLTGDDYISVNGYQLSLAIDAQGGLTNTGQGLGIYRIPSAKIVTDALGYTPLSTAGGTINGALGMGGIEILDKKSNALYIGYGSANRSELPTYLWGKGINFINSGGHTRMFIADGGNVGIGTTSPAYKLDVNGNSRINGNLIVAGDTSSGSDIRFKDKITDHRIALSDIAEAPLFTFKWNDRDDDSVHLGSSAQYWEKVAPWLVKGEDFKTLDYSTLGVAIGISLANKTLNLEDRVKILEDKVKALEAENRRLRYGS